MIGRHGRVVCKCGCGFLAVYVCVRARNHRAPFGGRRSGATFGRGVARIRVHGYAGQGERAKHSDGFIYILHTVMQ